MCGFVRVCEDGLCKGERGLRSEGWGAGTSVGCLWQGGQLLVFLQGFVGLVLNILCVSGTWQLYASTDREGQWTKGMCNDWTRETMLLC